MTHAEERRARLLTYMQSRKHIIMGTSTNNLARFATFKHHGADLAIYVGNGRYDKCNRDLKVLEREGKVKCTTLKVPARWVAI